MGKTKEFKGEYFKKLQDLVTSYRESSGVKSVRGRDGKSEGKSNPALAKQLPSSSSTSTMSVPTRCTRSDKPSEARVRY